MADDYVNELNAAISSMRDNLSAGQMAMKKSEKDEMLMTIGVYEWCKGRYIELNNMVHIEPEEYSDETILHIGKIRMKILRKIKQLGDQKDSIYLSDLKTTLRTLDTILQGD